MTDAGLCLISSLSLSLSRSLGAPFRHACAYMLSKVDRTPLGAPRLHSSTDLVSSALVDPAPKARVSLKTMLRSSHRLCCPFRCASRGSLFALFCLLYVSLLTIPCTAYVLRDHTAVHRNTTRHLPTSDPPLPSRVGRVEHVESEPISTVHEESFMDPCKAGRRSSFCRKSLFRAIKLITS